MADRNAATSEASTSGETLVFPMDNIESEEDDDDDYSVTPAAPANDKLKINEAFLTVICNVAKSVNESSNNSFEFEPRALTRIAGIIQAILQRKWMPQLHAIAGNRNAKNVINKNDVKALFAHDTSLCAVIDSIKPTRAKRKRKSEDGVTAKSSKVDNVAQKISEMFTRIEKEAEPVIVIDDASQDVGMDLDEQQLYQDPHISVTEQIYRNATSAALQVERNAPSVRVQAQQSLNVALARGNPLQSPPVQASRNVPLTPAQAALRSPLPSVVSRTHQSPLVAPVQPSRVVPFARPSVTNSVQVNRGTPVVHRQTLPPVAVMPMQNTSLVHPHVHQNPVPSTPAQRPRIVPSAAAQTSPAAPVQLHRNPFAISLQRQQAANPQPTSAAPAQTPRSTNPVVPPPAVANDDSFDSFDEDLDFSVVTKALPPASKSPAATTPVLTKKPADDAMSRHCFENSPSQCRMTENRNKTAGKKSIPTPIAKAGPRISTGGFKKKVALPSQTKENSQRRITASPKLRTQLTKKIDDYQKEILAEANRFQKSATKSPRPASQAIATQTEDSMTALLDAYENLDADKEHDSFDDEIEF